jgi:hypothetical protein
VVWSWNTWFNTVDSNCILASQHRIAEGPRLHPVVHNKFVFLVDNLVCSLGYEG